MLVLNVTKQYRMNSQVRKILIFLTMELVILLHYSSAWELYTEIPPQITEHDVLALVHISSEAEAKSVRQTVIEYVWQKGELPTEKLPVVSEVYCGQAAFPSEIITNINMSRVTRVEKLDVHVDYGYHHISFLLHPASQYKSPRLAIVHQGHQGGLNDGIGDVANYLIGRGFYVLLTLASHRK